MKSITIIGEELTAEVFARVVERLVKKAQVELPTPVAEALQKARKCETCPSAISQLEAIAANCRLAYEEDKPICQDTGSKKIDVSMGYKILKYINFNIQEATQLGVRLATESVPLRKNVVDFLTNKSSPDNTEKEIPHIDVRFVEGSNIEITVLAKGGGSENVSKLIMLSSAKEETIPQLIVETALTSLRNSCAPNMMSVYIGGTSAAEAMTNATRGLFIPHKITKSEKELMDAINAMGPGPMGLSGDSSLLDLVIKTGQRHPASLPVGMVFGCWALRYASAKLTHNKNGWELIVENTLNYLDLLQSDSMVDSQPKKIHHLTTPLRIDDIKKLNIGDVVSLAGTIFTARDLAHKEIMRKIEEGEELPFNLNEVNVVFHTGLLTKEENGSIKIIGAGPTTSARMASFTKDMVELGVVGFIGKSGMKNTESALKDRGIYLAYTGGCAVSAAKNMKIKKIHWPKMGMEAVWELEVENFGPMIVGIDTHGKDLYEEVAKISLKKYQDWLKGFNAKKWLAAFKMETG